MKRLKIFFAVGFIFILILSLVIASSIKNKSLSEEKQERRSEILRSYINGEITKEEGIKKLNDLSCEIAQRSGVKYNVRLCYGG